MDIHNLSLHEKIYIHPAMKISFAYHKLKNSLVVLKMYNMK